MNGVAVPIASLFETVRLVDRKIVWQNTEEKTPAFAVEKELMLHNSAKVHHRD